MYTVRSESSQTKAINTKTRRWVFFFSVYLFKTGSIRCNTKGMSKLSSDRLHFVCEGHETVAYAHSYFANFPEGVRFVLFAVARWSC
jgi:1-acyl-sn-glycerol-3-phosphate acyltransferase